MDGILEHEKPSTQKVGRGGPAEQCRRTMLFSFRVFFCWFLTSVAALAFDPLMNTVFPRGAQVGPHSVSRFTWKKSKRGAGSDSLSQGKSRSPISKA